MNHFCPKLVSYGVFWNITMERHNKRIHTHDEGRIERQRKEWAEEMEVGREAIITSRHF